MTYQVYCRCHSNHCVYFKRIDNGIYIILLLYVDDMLVLMFKMKDINVIERKQDKSFFMDDLGAAKQIIGMRIIRDMKNHQLTLS